MKRKKIIAHVLVKNEEVWIWYALMSVLQYIDELMVWDTGSTDRTVEIIKSINNPKIKFEQVDPTNNESDLSQARTSMLSSSSQYDWMLVLDGDEVWPNHSIKSAVDFVRVNGDNFDCVVVPTLNCVGDVFHVTPPSAGKYQLAGRTGHYNIRFINLKIPGLHVTNPVDKLQSYVDHEGVALQDRNIDKICHLDTPYLHMTHLSRSNHQNDKKVFWRDGKKKYDLGLALSSDFEYPACFYLPHLSDIGPAFRKRTFNYLIKAFWQTPLRRIKNHLHA